LLHAYILRLDGAEWYQKQLDEIMSLFSPGEFESDKPLSGKYLMGYSLQRRELYKSKTNKENENYESDEEN
jgi:CRISPR-associated protein Csd1